LGEEREEGRGAWANKLAGKNESLNIDYKKREGYRNARTKYESHQGQEQRQKMGRRVKSKVFPRNPGQYHQVQNQTNRETSKLLNAKEEEWRKIA